MYEVKSPNAIYPITDAIYENLLRLYSVRNCGDGIVKFYNKVPDESGHGGYRYYWVTTVVGVGR